MGLRDLAAVLTGTGAQQRSLTLPWPMSDALRYGSHTYLLNGSQSYGPQIQPQHLAAGEALASNGIAYGIFRQRVDLFAQGRFRFRRFGNPRPTLADSYSTGALDRVQPERALLELCELSVATAGAGYFVDDGPLIRRLPAEHCTIILGSNSHPDDPHLAWDARKLGIIYKNPAGSLDPEVWAWDEVYAYIPETDPVNPWRGISWLRPAMEDIDADNGARRYLTKFFQNHATPNTAVVFAPEVPKENVTAFRDLFLERHQGVERSFRTAFLGGGADIKVIGASLKDLDTADVRQQVHKDIAGAAGVPIVAAGIEQGTYANSKEAKRALADSKVRYLWTVVAETFAPAIAVPAGSELYIETAHIAALQADALDDAQVLAVQAQTMRTLGDGGWDKASVVAGVTKGDLSTIVDTGLVPVQLLPPGTAKDGGSNG